MKIYVGSDFHWGHANIMKFCPVTRAPYRDVAHMNETMVLEWNSIVEPGDLVYMLGDIAFMSGFDASKIVNQLNGEKILIEGNHDVKTLKDTHFRSAFRETHKYHEIVYQGTKVCMFHYPIAEWNQMHRGSVMLHGHLHGNTSGLEEYRSLDVGMDATGSIVISIEDAIARALKGKIKGHHV